MFKYQIKNCTNKQPRHYFGGAVLWIYVIENKWIAECYLHCLKLSITFYCIFFALGV
jgi:hypothetical protein